MIQRDVRETRRISNIERFHIVFESCNIKLIGEPSPPPSPSCIPSLQSQPTAIPSSSLFSHSLLSTRAFSIEVNIKYTYIYLFFK